MLAPVSRLVNPAGVVRIGPLFPILNPTSWGLLSQVLAF